MKFIFPQNYTTGSKLFGFLDYSTVIINIVFCAFVFSFLSLLSLDLNIRIFLFILICFPFIIFCFVGFNHENILYVLLYILKYLKNPKYYIYK